MISTRRWIMIADEDEAFRKTVTDLLVSHFGKDVKIVQASDGLAASTKIKNQAFHLIIAHIDLPKKDGEELTQIARENPFNETTPIIMMTSTDEHDHAKIEKAFEFVSCTKKPIEPFEFAKQIRNLFAIGTTEYMVSASIFSSLLDSSLGFLNEALGEDKKYEVGEMTLKKRGQELTADYAAIITVMVGKVSNTFSVLADKATLELLRDSSEKISGSSLDVICKSLGYVILKHVLTDCGIIHSNQVHTKDISQDSDLLTGKQGIMVPISAEGIDYKIFGTTKGGD